MASGRVRMASRGVRMFSGRIMMAVGEKKISRRVRTASSTVWMAVVGLVAESVMSATNTLEQRMAGTPRSLRALPIERNCLRTMAHSHLPGDIPRLQVVAAYSA